VVGAGGKMLANAAEDRRFVAPGDECFGQPGGAAADEVRFVEASAPCRSAPRSEARTWWMATERAGAPYAADGSSPGDGAMAVDRTGPSRTQRSTTASAAVMPARCAARLPSDRDQKRLFRRCPRGVPDRMAWLCRARGRAAAGRLGARGDRRQGHLAARGPTEPAVPMGRSRLRRPGPDRPAVRTDHGRGTGERRPVPARCRAETGLASVVVSGRRAWPWSGPGRRCPSRRPRPRRRGP
jgi:hypothetical protein